MSYFESISATPEDPIFGLVASYKKDPRSDKFSFIMGYFLDENLRIPVLETVAKVEKKLADEKKSKEYLPIDGDQEFINEIGKLVFGKGLDSERVCGIQTVGGTGALYLAATFAKHWTSHIAYSQPTWPNHPGIFKLADLTTDTYPYYENKKLQFEWMVEKLKTLPEKSCVLLHTNCHNPTGLDLSKEQWKCLSDLFHQHHLFPFFDMAYQGFSGSPEEDAFAPRLFLEEGHEMMLTYSCAKNFSLYSERVGALFVVADSPKKIPAIRSQLKTLVRGSYSNPPAHGTTIVKSILKDKELREEWLEELSHMRNRIKKVRKQFAEGLANHAPDVDWEFIRKGEGLFCLCEMSQSSIEWLRNVKGLYIAENGRINLTGLNHKNLKTFIEALVQKRNTSL